MVGPSASSQRKKCRNEPYLRGSEGRLRLDLIRQQLGQNHQGHHAKTRSGPWYAIDGRCLALSRNDRAHTEAGKPTPFPSKAERPTNRQRLRAEWVCFEKLLA